MRDQKFFSFILLFVLLGTLSCGKGKSERLNLFKIELQEVEKYLPDKIEAKVFHVKYLGKINRYSSFSLPIIFHKAIVKRFHAMIFEKHYGDGKENFKALPVSVHYNFVIMKDHIAFIKNGENFLRDYSSKHARLSEVSDKVYYAGTFWFDGTKITFDNNSGTYRPSADQGPNLVALMTRNFPHISFEFQKFVYRP